MATMDIHFDNVTYRALLIPEPIWSENGLHKGRMLRILNNNDEPIGCIGVFFSLTTKAVWRNVTDTAITDDFIERIILTIIPRVHFPLNFTQVSTLYQSHRCLPVYVSSTDTGYNEERNTVYLFGENTPQDFIHKIVFKGHITDEKIQREVLDI